MALASALTTPLRAGEPSLAANDFKPAVAYSFGGKGDGTFNDAAALGVKRFIEHSGVPIREYDPGLNVTTTDGLVTGLETLLAEGADPILAIGYNYEPVIRTVAARHPDRRFVIIDAPIGDLPNVSSVLFREDQGSFLVGLLAAKAARSGVVGFIGGMDISVIHRFECGYRQGARHADPDITVLVDYHGKDGSGFKDPAWGRRAALAQFDRGADVVFAAAGPTGLGVFEAAAERGKLAIGVDTNQNGVRPGVVLTSMLKRVDVAVYRALLQARRGQWRSGIETLGLAEEAVGWALDQHNASLITADMQAAAIQAQFGIISEAIATGGPGDLKACLGR